MDVLKAFYLCFKVFGTWKYKYPIEWCGIVKMTYLGIRERKQEV